MAKASVFAKRMSALGKRVETNFDRKVNTIALAVDKAILETTPVDTGQAISNWVAVLGGPSSGQIQPYVPGKFGSTHTANIQAAYAQAVYTITPRTGNTPIYISNAAVYINKLNSGTSTQAPSGFVQNSVAYAVRSTRNVKVLT